MADQAQSVTLTYLDVLIGNQRGAVRWYAAIASTMVLLGLVVFGISHVWGERLTGEPLKTLLGVAGFFVTAGCGAFPLKEVLHCRAQLAAFKVFRQILIAAAPDEAERIRDTVWSAISKVAGG